MAADTKFNMVAEEGNRRTGGMDKTEIRQCALGRSDHHTIRQCALGRADRRRQHDHHSLTPPRHASAFSRHRDVVQAQLGHERAADGHGRHRKSGEGSRRRAAARPHPVRTTPRLATSDESRTRRCCRRCRHRRRPPLARIPTIHHAPPAARRPPPAARRPPPLSFMEQAGGGGIWFYEKEMLPAESLAKRSSELDSGCVPFASDVDSNL